MRIALYAPLKAPTSPSPSGDRLIGQLLVRALEDAGHDVDLVSTFRSYEGKGNRRRQRELEREGRQVAESVLGKLRNDPPDLWFTYHLYFRAPDWLGPGISSALGIPYVVAEASFAPKQAGGPWGDWHREIERTLGQADLVVGFASSDRPCVEPCLSETGRYLQLPPFLDTDVIARAFEDRHRHRKVLETELGVAGDTLILLTVAMMRPGYKMESYGVLGAAMGLIGDRDWRLAIIGDGPEEDKVRAALAGVDHRVSWRGKLGAREVARHYAGSDVFLWPSVRETPGMCFLEAGAAGLPSVGGNAGGVPDVIDDGVTGFLAARRDAADFADKTMKLLDDETLRKRMGDAARGKILGQHDIRMVGDKLANSLEELVR